MIEFKNVSKVYDNGTHALSDVSLKVEPGEFGFVVGASGAGKSTFLKLIMHEEVPTSGTIRINDYDLGNMPKRKIPMLRREMGIVFQDFRLIPNMTVYDNVAFAMRVIGAKSKEISKKVTSVLNLVGLSAKARCYPRELSGGEQQRVALARSLVNNADIIIADEPTGNVDPQMSLEIIELLLSLNEKGKTIVLVTHEHSLVRRFNKRVIILENGCVVYDGINSYEDALKSSQGHIELVYAGINTGSRAENEKDPSDEEMSETDKNPDDSVFEGDTGSGSEKSISDSSAQQTDSSQTPSDIQSFLNIPEDVDFTVFQANDDWEDDKL